MARQNRSKSAEAVEVEVPTTEENTVTEVTEAVEADTTEAPVDLTAFQSAVTAALAEADSATGELPEAAVASVNEAYRSIEGTKGKRSARDLLDAGMLEAVGKLDAVAARGYSDLKAKLSAAGGTKSAATPADPTAAFVQRVASLRLALTIVEADRPEGEDVDAKVEALVNESLAGVEAQRAYLADTSEDKGEGPELTPVVRAAFKAAAAKGGAGRGRGNSGGVRRDIAKHILSAFAEVEAGTFLTIAEIAKHKSEEYAGTDGPSQGAISARLFPETTIEGIEPINKGELDGKNPKGARKVA